MSSGRLPSIDIFRGSTMLLMIFVNDLASVRGLPWWNYHLPASANGMTYVDMVFPTFLFIVGLSLPLAIESRVRKGESWFRIWNHILARTAGLLVLGIALANAGKCSSMPPNLWGFLVLLSGILFWGGHRQFRYLGLGGLLLLFATFRRTDTYGATHWLDFSYWEILGIIGWTYLATCVFYIPTRRWRLAPAVWLGVFCAYNVWNPRRPPVYLLPLSNGAFCLLVFAGIVCAQLLLSKDWFTTLEHRLRAGLVYALLLASAGVSLLPFGISKIRATPSWCLFTAAADTLIFLALHFICDEKKRADWAAFVMPAGANTILTYLLPDLYYFGVAIPWLPQAANQGLPGVLRAAVFTALMLAIAAVLTKWRLRMQL